jgi:hypothetical protein
VGLRRAGPCSYVRHRRQDVALERVTEITLEIGRDQYLWLDLDSDDRSDSIDLVENGFHGNAVKRAQPVMGLVRCNGAMTHRHADLVKPVDKITGTLESGHIRFKRRARCLFTDVIDR